MLHKSRLTLTHKRLAVRVARDHSLLDLKEAQEARSAIKADSRTGAINPGLVSLFVEIVLAIVQYIQVRKKEKNGTEVLQSQGEDEVYLASLRYQK